ncbi:MAG: hypothetical protein LC808_11760, partial [Actinobacteria bacterium]|nr:hypothetical protein [Actinomycetota bacterium]
VFEQDNDLFVVMEHCEGLSLEREVGLLAQEGRTLPIGRIQRWATALAEILRKLHALGFVYGDLKSPHVIITPREQLRLLDLESVWPDPDPISEQYIVLGTPGYLSPQRAAGLEPAVTDDVYSFGAILYFMATGAEPSQAPHRLRLLDRPVSDLNPSTPRPLVDLIGRCLDPAPSARPASMAELEQLLGEIYPGGRLRVATLPANSSPSPLDHTRQVALRLCHAAVAEPHRRGVTWSNSDAPVGPPLRDINGGAAGILLALTQAAPYLRSDLVWETVEAAAHWLADSAYFPGGPFPGLYVGEAGVGLALLRAGIALEDRSLVTAAVEKGQHISSIPFSSPDLFNGTAGRLRFHLMLWETLGCREALRHAKAAGESLLVSAESNIPAEFSWRIPDGYEGASGSLFLGYAHGIAGIADSLLDLFEATADHRFADAARFAANRLLASGLPSLEGDTGLNWPGQPGDGQTPAVWCHGAAGIARFLANALRLDLSADMADAACRAAAMAERGSRWVGPSQCHGLAGNADILVDLYQATADTTYLAGATRLGRLLMAYTVRPDSLQPPSTSAVSSLDLMTGSAGLMACFLRLSYPQRVPHVLSLVRESKPIAYPADVG